MIILSIWIAGSTRSGKTTRLVSEFCRWIGGGLGKRRSASGKQGGVLILAANDDNRRDLADRLAAAIQGRSPVLSKTPLGFFQDEVMLFWPLLIQRLQLRAQFPLRLRPETEQELATELWREDLAGEELPLGVSEYRFVRRLLDLLLLAAVSGTEAEDIPALLSQGMEGEPTITWQKMGEMLLKWRNWCLERGFLTYGLIGELYWRYLLPDATYRQHLQRRYQGVLADDVDDYPAIARDLFDTMLDYGAVGAFSYNTDGKIRLGLNADPDYLAGLVWRCRGENLTEGIGGLVGEFQETLNFLEEPGFLTNLPPSVRSLQTISRADLLRQTADLIIQAVQNGDVQPSEIAIIAPGLDAIARYTLTEILSKKDIAIASLNDQRPLQGSPIIRALLTLLALVYPGLGRLVDRDAIAEMLVILTHETIDPVRAGLLSDYCYAPDPEQPRLLPVEAFHRWDRLGYRATKAYEEIGKWLQEQRTQQEQRLLYSPIILLDRAIQRFMGTPNLPYDQLAALRELMETAQHYWEVDGRLRRMDKELGRNTIQQFIQLLRQGTVTANPYPIRRLGSNIQTITLATIFQYRASRKSHRWHFWLDASSPLWLQGGAATLYGAHLFLKDSSGRPWTEEDTEKANEQRLERILRDLLGRVTERVYLCHSDLAVNGQEQLGPLQPLVHASTAIMLEGATLMRNS